MHFQSACTCALSLHLKRALSTPSNNLLYFAFRSSLVRRDYLYLGPLTLYLQKS